MKVGDSVKFKSSSHEKWWAQVGIVIEIDREKDTSGDQSVLVYWGDDHPFEWEYQENLQIVNESW